MRDYAFLYQISNYHKVKSFAIITTGTLILAVLATLFATVWYDFLGTLPYVSYVIASIRGDIITLNLFGLFYAQFLGGLFFIPSPDEAIFYYGLVKGNPLLLAGLISMAGYLLSQVLNYLLGVKFSKYIVHLVSKKKIYKARRFANKYGAYGIFVLNLIPSPAPLLTFSLGLTNYNFYRMMIWTTLGKALKYAAIIGLYVIVK